MTGCLSLYRVPLTAATQLRHSPMDFESKPRTTDEDRKTAASGRRRAPRAFEKWTLWPNASVSIMRTRSGLALSTAGVAGLIRSRAAPLAHGGGQKWGR